FENGVGEIINVPASAVQHFVDVAVVDTGAHDFADRLSVVLVDPDTRRAHAELLLLGQTLVNVWFDGDVFGVEPSNGAARHARHRLMRADGFFDAGLERPHRAHRFAEGLV